MEVLESVHASELRPESYFIHGPLGILSGDWSDCGELNGFAQGDWIRLEFREPGLNTVIVLDPLTLEERCRRPRLRADESLPEFGISGSLYIQDVLSEENVLRVFKNEVGVLSVV